MSKEAMKLRTAAEKVVELCSERPLSLGKWFIDMSEACESLLEALAEPTSADYAMGYAEGFNDACKPAQQEPVAAQSVMTIRIWRDKNSDQNAEFKNWHKLPDGEHILYTSPPTLSLAQRSEASTWVGLTDKEIGVLWFEANDQDNSMIKHFARAIEAKLRSKNEDRN